MGSDLSPGATSFNGPFSSTFFCFWEVVSRASGKTVSNNVTNLLPSCPFSRNFGDSTVSRLLRAFPCNIDGDNLVGELSLTEPSLSSDDFSFGETNFSSCCNIFEAISLDLEETGGKLVVGMLSPFSMDILVKFPLLDSTNKSGFCTEEEGYWAALGPTPVPRIETGLPETGKLNPLEDRRLGLWRILRIGPTDPKSLSKTELLRFKACKEKKHI